MQFLLSPIKVLTNSKWSGETDLQVAAEKRKSYFTPILDELRDGGRAALSTRSLDEARNINGHARLPRIESTALCANLKSASLRK